LLFYRTHSQSNGTDGMLYLARVELEAWTIGLFYLYYSILAYYFYTHIIFIL